MLNEKELINNTINNSNLFTPEALQNFENDLRKETKGFTYDREQLIQDIESFYLSFFHEPTEAVQSDAYQIIFPIANNSASLVITYSIQNGLENVITVKEVEII